MSGKRPKVSVIIPSYNEKEYIKETIESVMNQTLFDIEILCVDGGSDDGTLDLLKEYSRKDERIHVFLSYKKNYGLQVNQGLTNSNGEYITVITVGDYIEENMLEALHSLTQVRYIDIVKGNFSYFYPIGDENITEIDTTRKSLDNIKKPFKIENFPIFLEGYPSIGSAIYKRSFLIHNNIRFVEGDLWVNDPFFFETAIKANTIVYRDVPYYYHRKMDEKSSISNSTNLNVSVTRIKDMFKVLKENGCDNDEIKILLYNRLFKYIENINENSEKLDVQLDYEATKAIHDVLRKVDIDYVHEKLSKKNKQIYYKFASPLILAKFAYN